MPPPILGAYAGSRDLIASYASARGRRPLVSGDDGLILGAGTPLVDSNGWWCALHGSLLNARELAAELGRPDASVEGLILSAYRRWGLDCFSRLRGDFVVLVFDPNRAEGFIARDQLGGRAVYLSERSGSLLFASEIRDLLDILPRTPSPSRAVLAHWLSGRFYPDPTTTFFDGIRVLRGGHYLHLKDRCWRELRYWHPTARPQLTDQREDIVERLAAGVEHAIAARVGPHDRAAVSLSGGVDSSSVAALAVGTIPSLTAYTTVYPDNPELDEWRWVAQISQQLRLPVTRLEVRPASLLVGALSLLDAWRVPHFPPTYVFNQQLMARAANDGCTVLFDGEGGDELFGVSPYVIADELRRGRVTSAWRVTRTLLSAYGETSRRYVLKNLWELGVHGAMPLKGHRLYRRLRPQRYYGPPYLRSETADLVAAGLDEWRWKLNPGAPSRAHHAHLLTDFREELQVADYFRHRSEMAGIRSQSPLLDVDLVELALSIPPLALVDPRHDRPLIREATAGRLPDDVRLRTRKSEFSTLLRQSLRDFDMPAIRSLLGSDARIGEFVDLRSVSERLFSPSRTDTFQAWSFELWWLTTAEAWLRTLEDPAWAHRAVDQFGLREPECRVLEPVVADATWAPEPCVAGPRS